MAGQKPGSPGAVPVTCPLVLILMLVPVLLFGVVLPLAVAGAF